jgi:hypothetical protein
MITVQIETARFNADLAYYAKMSKKSTAKVVSMACSFIAKSFMVSTKFRDEKVGVSANFRAKKGEIIYNGKADLKLGKETIMREIGSVFGTHQQAFNEIKETSRDAAKGYAKAIADGNNEEAERILKSVGVKSKGADVGQVDPKMHKQNRKKGKGGTKHVMRFVDKKELEQYKKKVFDRIGFAKSAWFHLGLKFGKMTNVPAWIKRHAAPGMAIDNTKSSNPGASMTSLVRYASQILSDAKQAESMKYARGRMIHMMNAELAYNANKARLNRK